MLSARMDSTMAHKYHILSCLLSINDVWLLEDSVKAGGLQGAPPGAFRRRKLRQPRNTTESGDSDAEAAAEARRDPAAADAQGNGALATEAERGG